MTAFSKYQRLEASAIWRRSPNAQRRDVIISVGDATLVISDTKDQPLAHWSLAAIGRLNPNDRPAIYHPLGDINETLELAENETEMEEAIEILCQTINKRRPKPGRLRTYISVSSIILVFIFGALWLPNALKNYAVKQLPNIKKQEIGTSLFAQLQTYTGPYCISDNGHHALLKLGQRLHLTTHEIFVVPSKNFGVLELPGNIIVLSQSLVEDHDDPDIVAGYILAEMTQIQSKERLSDLLKFAGIWQNFRLIMGLPLSESILKKYAQTLLGNVSNEQDANELIAVFEKHNLSPIAYAYAVDVTGEATREIIDHAQSDIKTKSKETSPALPDGLWLALQSICEA